MKFVQLIILLSLVQVSFAQDDFIKSTNFHFLASAGYELEIDEDGNIYCGGIGRDTADTYDGLYIFKLNDRLEVLDSYFELVVSA